MHLVQNKLLNLFDFSYRLRASYVLILLCLSTFGGRLHPHYAKGQETQHKDRAARHGRISGSSRT